MRIIGGTAKGRRLAPFKGISIRPTSDRVRESIFNILSKPFFFKKALDVFAGTGAMGIEAISRGAASATFVDNDPKAVRIINKNLELCRFTERAVIISRDAIASLKILNRRGERFDLIFIDPPYDASLTGPVLTYVAKNRLLEPDGVIVVESSKRTPYDGETKGIKLLDRRRYGDTIVSFYKPD